MEEEVGGKVREGGRRRGGGGGGGGGGRGVGEMKGKRRLVGNVVAAVDRRRSDSPLNQPLSDCGSGAWLRVVIQLEVD